MHYTLLVAVGYSIYQLLEIPAGRESSVGFTDRKLTIPQHAASHNECQFGRCMLSSHLPVPS